MPSTLVELAQAAVTTPEFDRGVLALLQREVGTDVAFLTAGGPDAPATLGLDATRITRLLGDERFVRELLPVKRAALAARGVALDTEVLGETKMRALAYYRELAAPLGGRQSLVAYLGLRGRVTGALVLGRCGAPFGPREVRVVEALLPELSVARASYGRAASESAAFSALTPREREVLGYLRLGYTNREIACACATSPNTVRNQLASVFEKLGVSTRAEAAAISGG